MPTRTLDKKSREADLINMAFIGTREELAQAFQAAGWKQSDSVSRHSVMRQLYAFLAKSSYATAPMSRQFFDGRSPDLTSEKTFDSYDRRDHLRIWKLESTVDDVPLWVGAAVRETGATLSVTRMAFMHHVLDDLGEEQRAIQRHLLAADCVDSVGKVERPGMEKAVINATGEVLRTDGGVLVLYLKACSDDSSTDFNSVSRFRPGSKSSRYLRKEILTVRSDLLARQLRLCVVPGNFGHYPDTSSYVGASCGHPLTPCRVRPCPCERPLNPFTSSRNSIVGS